MGLVVTAVLPRAGRHFHRRLYHLQRPPPLPPAPSSFSTGVSGVALGVVFGLGGRVLLAGLAGLALHRLERARRRLEGVVWELSRLEVSLATRGRRAPGPHLAAAARLLGEGLEELEGLRRLLERLAREATGAEVSLGLCREDVGDPQAVVHIERGELVVELCEAGCGECEEHTIKLEP